MGKSGSPKKRVLLPKLRQLQNKLIIPTWYNRMVLNPIQ